MNAKFIKESRVIHTDLILPNDTNNHNTLFGGVLMKKMDGVASIAARKHCRKTVVTASIDSIDFLGPFYPTDSMSLEAFVTSTGRTSMEVFVKAIAEDLSTGKTRIAATAFVTFVSMGEDGKPSPVPEVIPETEEEKKLNTTAKRRAESRKIRKEESKEFANYLTLPDLKSPSVLTPLG